MFRKPPHVDTIDDRVPIRMPGESILFPVICLFRQYIPKPSFCLSIGTHSCHTFRIRIGKALLIHIVAITVSPFWQLFNDNTVKLPLSAIFRYRNPRKLLFSGKNADLYLFPGFFCTKYKLGSPLCHCHTFRIIISSSHSCLPFLYAVLHPYGCIFVNYII